MTLYHVTDTQNINSILRQGLRPLIDNNSAVCSEEMPTVYLCDEKSVPFWEILLRRRSVLKVEDTVPAEVYNYSCYNEYLLYESVSPEKISPVTFPEPPTSIMKKLCIEHIYAISELCVRIINLYHYSQHNSSCDKLLKELDLDLTGILTVLYRLDFSLLSQQEIKNTLIEYASEGEYTFLDTFQNKNIRLYEQIVHFKQDVTKTNREKLFCFVKDTFKDCLELDTGGWGQGSHSEDSSPKKMKL